MSNKIYIPLISPIKENGEVCSESVHALMELSREYTAGYIPCLTSGEGWLLSDAQWQDMVRACVGNAGNKKIIAGIEKATTQEVVAFAKLAESLGAEGVMVTTPFGEHVSQKEMLAHFHKVHDAIGIEVFIYNENSLSKNVVTSELLMEISCLPRVVGVKESMDNDVNPNVLKQLKTNGVTIYQGWENRIVNDELSEGNICSLSNLYPEVCSLAAQTNNAELEATVDKLCTDHRIFEEDWYRHIKAYLFSNGVISTDYVLS